MKCWENYYHGAWFLKKPNFATIQIKPWFGYETIQIEINWYYKNIIYVKCLYNHVNEQIISSITYTSTQNIFNTFGEKRYRKCEDDSVYMYPKIV